MEHRGHRWVVAVAAVVLFGAELVSAAHSAFVQHAVCAEHGEPIDLGPVLAEGPAAGDFDTVSTGASRAASSDDHHHCTFSRRSPFALTRPKSLAALPFHRTTAHAPREPLLEAVVRLFRLAPKTSPPVIR